MTPDRWFHCSVVLKERGAAIPCPREAIVLWKDSDNVAHAFCLDHVRDGHVEAVRNGWLVAESALERVA